MHTVMHIYICYAVIIYKEETYTKCAQPGGTIKNLGDNNSDEIHNNTNQDLI